MFQNRSEAGRLLAERLMPYKNMHPVVLALPRGGVEVAYEIAEALDAPLDIVVARKLGAPGHEELAIGAVVDGDHPMMTLNEEVMQSYGVDREYLSKVVHRELREIERRQRLYRGGRPPVPVKGAAVIVVDDGIATGASARAALRGLRRKDVGRLILAVPVAPMESARDFAKEVDELVCLENPDPFFAVGAHYRDFSQTTDETVIELLQRASRRAPPVPIN